jgi:hypothetical protein
MRNRVRCVFGQGRSAGQGTFCETRPRRRSRERTLSEADVNRGTTLVYRCDVIGIMWVTMNCLLVMAIIINNLHTFPKYFSRSQADFQIGIKNLNYF